MNNINHSTANTKLTLNNVANKNLTPQIIETQNYIIKHPIILNNEINELANDLLEQEYQDYLTQGTYTGFYDGFGAEDNEKDLKVQINKLETLINNFYNYNYHIVKNT